ncbi:MAG: gp58-like family protein [Turicibacter sp.]|nr:gp58-like family protein [Turicibacter sp.]
MSYPIIYEAGTVEFGHMGLGILNDATYCLVTEERNGRFQLNLRYPMTGIHAEHLKVDHVIKADAGHALKGQLFRIERVDKNAEGMIEVLAHHVSYLAQSLVLEPEVVIDNETAATALDRWRRAIVGEHGFTTASDMTETRSARLRIQNFQNAREALGGGAGSILAVWGGEYRFDNYRVELLRNRGSVANTLISYGRNLTDLRQEENISQTFTSIYPYAIYRNGDVERIVTLSGSALVMDSEYADRFAHRRVLPVDFSREFARDVVPTAAKLRELGLAFMAENAIGLPRVSMSLRFVDLTKALNGAGLTYERLNLCDTVPVRFEKLGIDTSAQIVRICWDVLLDQYDSLEIGEVRATLSDRLRGVEREMTEVSGSANSALSAANGRNTVFFGIDELVANRVGDLWYRPNGEDTELFMWDGHGWEFVMSTAVDEDLLRRIDEARVNANYALGRANAAVSDAREATDRAQAAFDKAEPLVVRTDELSGQVTAVTALASGLQTTVTNNHNATATRITQLDHQINSRVGNLEGTVSSEITQLTNDINLRVRNGEVISQINVSPESVLIQGRRIHLTGQTTIDDAVIESAHIASLEADKIQTGTLNAANVNVINLNANNITSGTLNAHLITAEIIEAAALRAGQIDINHYRFDGQSVGTVGDHDFVIRRGTGGSVSNAQRDRLIIGRHHTRVYMEGDDSSDGTAADTGAYGDVRDDGTPMTGRNRVGFLEFNANRLSAFNMNQRTVAPNTSVERQPLRNLHLQPADKWVRGIPGATLLGADRGGGEIRCTYTTDFGSDRQHVFAPLRARRLTIQGQAFNAGFTQLTRNIARHLNIDTTNERLMVTSNIAGTNAASLHVSSLVVGGATTGGTPNANMTRSDYRIGWCGSVGNSNFHIRRNNVDRISLGSLTTTIRGGAGGGNAQNTSVSLVHEGNASGSFNIGQSGTDVAAARRSRVWSDAVYSRTGTASSNSLRVTGYGTFERVASSARYKLNINRDFELEYAERVLNVEPASWFDRASSETYASMITSNMDESGQVDWTLVNEKAREEVERITRIGGLIAEDVEEAGLGMYVSYADDGKTVEGVQYDRLWTLLIPLVKDQRDRLSKQEREIQDLRKEMEELKNGK